MQPNHFDTPPPIRQLSEDITNRIAAGEVVERPCSVVKELVENALDADAQRINVTYANGGKTFIRVSDDGHGIAAKQLKLALSRHATSKIDDSNLLNINSFGFRGEALPSMAAVGRLSLISRTQINNSAARIDMDNGKITTQRPASRSKGTTVELRDLFYAMPARLKFLCTNRSESIAIKNTLTTLAMAQPRVGFTLHDLSGSNQIRQLFHANPQMNNPQNSLNTRISLILGQDFIQNSIYINNSLYGINLSGYISLPTYSYGRAMKQYLFVNGRYIKNHQLLNIIRTAYSDFLSRNHFARVVLFIKCAVDRVNVNVHPTKAKVQFKEKNLIYSLLGSTINQALSQIKYKPAHTTQNAAVNVFKSPTHSITNQNPTDLSTSIKFYKNCDRQQNNFAETQAKYPNRTVEHRNQNNKKKPQSVPKVTSNITDKNAILHPLGMAVAQLYQNYIISQTTNNMIIVDQQVAHQRLCYKKLKDQINQQKIDKQTLLLPEIIELSKSNCQNILNASTILLKLGLKIEHFGGTAICIRQIPAVLTQANIKTLIVDILNILSHKGKTYTLKNKIDIILNHIAYYGSLGSNRTMHKQEMNALLREIEKNQLSNQCTPKNPTYIELKLNDIKQLFKR